jgi:hypothetical protein
MGSSCHQSQAHGPSHRPARQQLYKGAASAIGEGDEQQKIESGYPLLSRLPRRSEAILVHRPKASRPCSPPAGCDRYMYKIHWKCGTQKERSSILSISYLTN